MKRKVRCQFEGCERCGSTANFGTHTNIKRCPLARDNVQKEKNEISTNHLKFQRIIEELKKKNHDLEIDLSEIRNKKSLNLVIKKNF